MKKFNFFKTGLSLGLFPLVGLGILLFVSWFGLTFFALDIDIDGIGFIYIMISVPIVLVGFIMTFISIFKTKFKEVYKPIVGLVLILLNIPTLNWILRTHGEISSRAYLKVINNTGRDFDNITIKEPDNELNFGNLPSKGSKIMFYNPDYKSTDGMTYPGIGQNYFLIKTVEGVFNKKLPTIHPGETHKIIIDKELNLQNIHLNQISHNN